MSEPEKPAVNLRQLLKTLPAAEVDNLWQAMNELRPTKRLADVNLEHELLAQYETVKRLQYEVLEDDAIPANQRAQVANTVAATLQQLVKMQTDFYNAERFKAIETLMIKALKNMPPEVAARFLQDYETLA